MKRKSIFANLAILLANIIYGINYLAVKSVIPIGMHPYALSVLRAVGALILLWASVFLIKSQKVERGDYWKLLVAGILGVAVNQTLLIAGLNYTSSINASIIMTMNPLIVMLMSALLLRNPVTSSKILGVISGGAGALLLIMSANDVSLNSDTALGDTLIFVNAIMYAVYLIWVKPLMKKYDAFTVMRWMFLFGSGFVLLFGGDELLETDFGALTTSMWGAVLFVVIGATFMTYLLNVYGLKYVNPSTVSIYINLQPIIASVAAVIIGSDHLDTYRLLSMILVVTGVFLVNRSNTSATKD